MCLTFFFVRVERAYGRQTGGCAYVDPHTHQTVLSATFLDEKNLLNLQERRNNSTKNGKNELKISMEKIVIWNCNSWQAFRDLIDLTTSKAKKQQQQIIGLTGCLTKKNKSVKIMRWRDGKKFRSYFCFSNCHRTNNIILTISFWSTILAIFYSVPFVGRGRSRYFFYFKRNW